MSDLDPFAYGGRRPGSPFWSTACLDWQDRIVEQPQRSLIPFDPLFPGQAEAALEIFRSLRIVDAAGRPTFGEVARPWIMDFVAAIFGAYDEETGRRLIQYFFMLISKKNGKSTLAAGIMVTALIRNWRDSGEYYILAPTKETADNSYKPARDMIMADPDLRSILKPSAGRVIEHRNTGAFLKVVAADSETVSGKKTIGLLVDELHVFGKRANAASMLLEATGGLASRPEGFVIYLSTQSDNIPAGVFAQKLQEFRDIRDGKVIDPGSLPVLYEYPKAWHDAEAYREPEKWYVTNPNLGASVNMGYLTDQLAKAQLAGRPEVNGFLAKHVNVEIGLGLRADRWAGAEYWEDATDPSLTLDEILRRSEVVVIGIDGGGLDDLLGLTVLGRCCETNHWLSWSHAWCHEGVLERRRTIADRLRDFARAGDLTIVGQSDLTRRYRAAVKAARDNAIAAGKERIGEADWSDDDRTAVKELRALIVASGAFPDDILQLAGLVERVNEAGILAEVGVDPAGLGLIVDALAAIDVTEENKKLVGVGQGYRLMNAIKTSERKLENATMWHAPSALMAWCVGNVKIEPTATAIRATKQNAGDAKIDPWAAAMNAVDRMSLNPKTAPEYQMLFLSAA
jgi:phage terminase large subunit-like protein